MYINSDRDKTKPRDKYIVVKPRDSTRPNTISVQKFAGSQLRSRIYVVNLADIIKVPVGSSPSVMESRFPLDEDSDDECLTLGKQCSDTAVDAFIHADEVIPEVAIPAELQRAAPAVAEQAPRRSGRERRAPRHLQDYVTQVNSDDSQSDGSL